METRNGFQDRDIGRSSLARGDFGPEYGPDYARFSDPPDLAEDGRLLDRVQYELGRRGLGDLRVRVRNGFVMVESENLDKERFKESVLRVPGVRDIIFIPRQ